MNLRPAFFRLSSGSYRKEIDPLCSLFESAAADEKRFRFSVRLVESDRQK